MSQLDAAIAEITSVRGHTAGPSVWIYGEMLWANPTAFAFVVIAEPPRRPEAKQVTILTDSVKRFRDGESHLFLIEMSAMMAHVLDVEPFVLTDAELENKKRLIRTDRPY